MKYYNIYKPGVDPKRNFERGKLSEKITIKYDVLKMSIKLKILINYFDYSESTISNILTIQSLG